MLGLLCCGAFSGYGVQASHCGGVSPFGAQALGWVGFSNCGIHRRVVTEPVKLKLEGGRRGVGQEVAGSGSLCKEEEANSD